MRLPFKLWLYWTYFKLAWVILFIGTRDFGVSGLKGWFHFMQLPLHLEISPRTAFREDDP